jgi:acyl carrier protein
MPDRVSLETMVATFIARELLSGSDVTPDPDENIFTSGYVDSVGIMRLIAHIESVLGLKIPSTDLIPDNFRTIATIAGYLAARTNANGGPPPGAASPP